MGDYTLSVSGAINYPIIIDTDATARIKGSIVITGHNMIVNGVNIFDEPATRTTVETGSSPSFIRPEGMSVYGTNLTIAHAMVYDILSNGAGFWKPAINSEIYGLWTINNGWDAPDRGHGHGLYTQNQSSGDKWIRLCMFAQGYSGGLRAFTTNQELESVHIEGCISLNDQLFLGGGSSASLCSMDDNIVWNDQIEIGETDQDNQDISVSGNYVVSGTGVGTSCVTMRYWKTPTVTGNTFVHRSPSVPWQVIPHTAPSGLVINNNTYYVTDLLAPFAIVYPAEGGANYYTIAQWQSLGYDIDSTFIEGLPTTNVVVVKHSEYNDDIAHVAIFNWEDLSAVDVDFSGGNFTISETYRAYNAMNPDEYEEFTYNGVDVSIPMTGWTRKIPAGDTTALTEDTWPTFLALVVKKA